jgi:hypothetical protein
MKFVSRRVVTVSVLFLSACQMISAQTTKPAVLVNPGIEAREELNQAIVAITGFSHVSLSTSDLTQSSDLVIERKHQRDGHGELLQGRDLEMPQRIQLVLQDGQCWLQQLSSGKRQLLKLAQCKPNLP